MTGWMRHKKVIGVKLFSSRAKQRMAQLHQCPVFHLCEKDVHLHGRVPESSCPPMWQHCCLVARRKQMCLHGRVPYTKDTRFTIMQIVQNTLLSIFPHTWLLHFCRYSKNTLDWIGDRMHPTLNMTKMQQEQGGVEARWCIILASALPATLKHQHCKLLVGELASLFPTLKWTCTFQSKYMYNSILYLSLQLLHDYHKIVVGQREIPRGE